MAYKQQKYISNGSGGWKSMNKLPALSGENPLPKEGDFSCIFAHGRRN